MILNPKHKPMNNTKLIIQREYLARVRKKSFIVMTLLTPLLMSLFMVLPVWLTLRSSDELRTILVVDETTQALNKIQDTEYLKFEYLRETDMEAARALFFESDYHAVVHLTDSSMAGQRVDVFSLKQPAADLTMHIQRFLEGEIKAKRLNEMGLDQDVLASLKTNVKVTTTKWSKDGRDKQTSGWIYPLVGLMLGLLIYMFVFIYGLQVMRGVMEEKTSRVVEIIVSSVRPFQLLLGKIIGIALVAFTQFFIWALLTGILTVFAQGLLVATLSPQGVQAQNLQEVVQATGNTGLATDVLLPLSNLPFGRIIVAFLFYFVFGYLMYAALFGAIGSATDSETDSQQFSLPVTMPLILAIAMVQVFMTNPDGSLAFWFSMIPLTSPVVMLVRVPFGVPLWELLLSMGLLFGAFMGATWLAARIYRTGILMYGKKVTYRELMRWIRFK